MFLMFRLFCVHVPSGTAEGIVARVLSCFWEAPLVHLSVKFGHCSQKSELRGRTYTCDEVQGKCCRWW